MQALSFGTTVDGPFSIPTILEYLGLRGRTQLLFLNLLLVVTATRRLDQGARCCRPAAPTRPSTPSPAHVEAAKRRGFSTRLTRSSGILSIGAYDISVPCESRYQNG
ncbi:hypothetical protein PMIN04_008717 [Paraphaeosphaeria minitans]